MVIKIIRNQQTQLYKKTLETIAIMKMRKISKELEKIVIKRLKKW